MRETGCELPSLDELGRDLLHVPVWRTVVSLVAPFDTTRIHVDAVVARLASKT